MPLPLDALREVQEGLSNNMWMLGLPELAPFRAFILDAAAQCESGAVERALREVRREAKEEREEQQRQSRDERPGVTRLSSPPAADAREIEEMVRARASAVLPQRSPDNPRLSLAAPRCGHAASRRRSCSPSAPPSTSCVPPSTQTSPEASSWTLWSSSCRSGWSTARAAAWAAWRSGLPSTSCCTAPGWSQAPRQACLDPGLAPRLAPPGLPSHPQAGLRHSLP